ncbi:MAG: TrmH family RNA methyltransferase, partial [Smithellaceae bacterium]
PRAVRASMGSIFHLNIIADVKLAAALPEIKKHLPVIAGDARRGEEPRPLSQRAALLLGSESHGLPEELLALADKRWRIPGGGKTESLSLPQAGAIMMYEMRREG